MAAAAESRKRTRRPRREREAQILDSARQVFSEKGYGAAAVAEIAARAGVVEGTVYSYFESKRALLIAVMKAFFEELIADTESGLAARRCAARRTSSASSSADISKPSPPTWDSAASSSARRARTWPSTTKPSSISTDATPAWRSLFSRKASRTHAVWRFVFTDGALEVGMLSDQLADAILDGIVGGVRSDVTRESIHNQETVLRLERAVARLESTLEQSPS